MQQQRKPAEEQQWYVGLSMWESRDSHVTPQRKRLSQLRRERELEEFENENKVRELKSS